MLKIVKYEFRKSRTSLLVMLLIAAGLFLLAPLGKALHREYLMALSLILLLFYAFAAFVYALVRGISAYSGELRGKTGYLLMMIPRSTMSVLFGKLLFSLAMALLMLAATTLALGASFTMLTAQNHQIEGALNMLRFGMTQIGLDPAHLATTALYFTVDILCSVLLLVGIGYLSVTLSATVLQEGKFRGLLSFLFFVALLMLTGWLEDFVTPELNEMYVSFDMALRAALPSTILFVAMTCACTATSAVLLQKKVSL